MQAIVGDPVKMLQSLTPAEWKFATDMAEKIFEWACVLAAGIAYKKSMKVVRAIRPGIAADVMLIATKQIDEKLAAQWEAHEIKSSSRFSKIDHTLQAVLDTQGQQTTALERFSKIDETLKAVVETQSVQAATMKEMDSHKQDQVREFRGLREDLAKHYPKLAPRSHPI